MGVHGVVVVEAMIFFVCEVAYVEVLEGHDNILIFLIVIWLFGVGGARTCFVEELAHCVSGGF